MAFDVVVIGAGLAGCAAAARAAGEGARVAMVASGLGRLFHLGGGSLDVLAVRAARPVRRPLAEVAALATSEPEHPYAILGLEAVRRGLALIAEIAAREGYPFSGAAPADGAGLPPDQPNLWLPTALGGWRAAFLAPASMVGAAWAGTDAWPLGREVLVAGFQGYGDFSPELLARGIRHSARAQARSVWLDVPGVAGASLAGGLSAPYLGRYFDRPGAVAGLAGEVGGRLGRSEVVIFPALLGLERSVAAHSQLEALLGRPVAEVPALPPSLPGLRLWRAIRRYLAARGVRFYLGATAAAAEPAAGGRATTAAGGRLASIRVRGVSREVELRAGAFVLATGGIGGGGIALSPGPPPGGPVAREAVLGLRLSEAGAPHLPVNHRLQPPGPGGEPAWANLFAAGSILCGHDLAVEGSASGIAAASGCRAGELALDVL